MNTAERNLTVYDAQCRNQHSFEAYGFSDFIYGERIIRTTDGQAFALLTIEDRVAKEVGTLLDEIYQEQLDQMERAAHFNQVFGRACDSLDGKQLDASVRIICPVCGSSEISYGDFVPPRFKRFAIPLITHEHWSRLSREEKRLMIEEALHSKGLL